MSVSSDQIDPVELAYHRSVVEGFKRAQALRQEIVMAEAAFHSWAQYLHEKYGLDAAAGDSIDEAGQITRTAREG